MDFHVHSLYRMLIFTNVVYFELFFHFLCYFYIAAFFMPVVHLYATFIPFLYWSFNSAPTGRAFYLCPIFQFFPIHLIYFGWLLLSYFCLLCHSISFVDINFRAHKKALREKDRWSSCCPPNPILSFPSGCVAPSCSEHRKNKASLRSPTCCIIDLVSRLKRLQYPPLFVPRVWFSRAGRARCSFERKACGIAVFVGRRGGGVWKRGRVRRGQVTVLRVLWWGSGSV